MENILTQYFGAVAPTYRKRALFVSPENFILYPRYIMPPAVAEAFGGLFFALRYECIYVVLLYGGTREELNAEFPNNPYGFKYEDFDAVYASNRSKPELVAEFCGQVGITPQEGAYLSEWLAELKFYRDIFGTDILPVQFISHSPETALLTLSPDFNGNRYSPVGGVFEDNFAPADRKTILTIKRALHAVHFAYYSDFLKSLNLSALFRRYTGTDKPVVRQLFRSAKLFALGDRHYTTEDIESALRSKNCACFLGYLSDKFGEYGLSSLILTRFRGETGRKTADILYWVMPDNALDRRMENAAFTHLLSECLSRGAATVNGRFSYQNGNAEYSEFYNKFGFEADSAATDNTDNVRTYSRPVPNKIYGDSYVRMQVSGKLYNKRKQSRTT
jgi:hypothetical protein